MSRFRARDATRHPSARPAAEPAPIPARAALRAFLYGGRLGPRREAILGYPDSAIARSLATLRSDDWRCIEPILAGHQRSMARYGAPTPIGRL